MHKEPRHTEIQFNFYVNRMLTLSITKQAKQQEWNMCLDVGQYNKSMCLDLNQYPLSYGVPVRERYGSTLLPATREQHDQNCTQSH